MLEIAFDGVIYQSDIAYYYNMREKSEFNVDQARLQQYFPYDVVLNGIFDIYQVNKFIVFFVFYCFFSTY